MKIKSCKHKQHGTHFHSKRLEDAVSALKAAGARVTKQKILLLKTLIGRNEPLSTDQIFAVVGRKGVDRVTIYRNLTALETLGLVQRQDFGDGVKRYEFYLREHHHHYIRCRECGVSESVSLCGVTSKVETALKQKGFRAVAHNLSFSALCPKCA